MKIKHLKLTEITYDRKDRQRHTIDSVEDLTTSIQQLGLIHPIVVDETSTLIAGERRLTAAKALEWKTIPCIVSTASTQETKQLIELDENLKRKNITWQEETEARERISNLFKKLNPDWTKDDISKAMGIARNTLAKAEFVQKAIKKDPSLSKAATQITAFTTAKRRQERAVAHELETILNPVQTEIVSHRLICADFNEWSSKYKGARFNFIHCDFPYGINYQNVKQANAGIVGGTYDDSEDVYWHLLEVFAKNLDRFCADSAHLMFWFSMNHYTKTMEFFRTKTDFKLLPHPLVWHKSCGTGLLPDPSRGPRRIYETALFGSRGDRLIVKAKANTYAAPASRTEASHLSEKSQPMLANFFQMVVDENTCMLDPTCGGGSSIRALAQMGMGASLGLDINHNYINEGKKRLGTQITLAREIQI